MCRLALRTALILVSSSHYVKYKHILAYAYGRVKGGVVGWGVYVNFGALNSTTVHVESTLLS